MNQTDKTLLALLGRALFDAKVNIPENIDWNELYNESKSQAVNSLIFSCLTDTEIENLPSDLKEKWRNSTYSYFCFYQQLLYEQKNVIKLLSDNNIDAVVLKGTSVAVNYPEPYLRLMGDIDLLVTPENQPLAIEILQKNGYSDVLDEEHHCHMTLHKGKLVVEIHNEPNGIFLVKDIKIKQLIRHFFSDAIEKSNIQDGNPILSDHHQAVLLILHKLEHFIDSGLGLRQICDWAVFVQKRMTKELFEKVKPFLKDFGMYRFACVVTRACCDYLHLPQENVQWCLEADEYLVEDFIQRILQSGNFGIKENSYGQNFFIEVNSKNRFKNFIKAISSACKRYWPICEKHPSLFPIAPFVLLFKYTKLRKKGERPPMNPVNAFKKAGPRQKLYNELKPFISQENF